MNGVVDIAVLLYQTHKPDNTGTFHIGFDLSFVIHSLHFSLEHFNKFI